MTPRVRRDLARRSRATPGCAARAPRIATRAAMAAGSLEAAPAAPVARAATLQEGELVILIARPSAWMFTGRAALVTGAFAVGATVMWALGVLGGAIAVVLLAWGAMVAWCFAEWRMRWYILTDRRVMAVRGLVRTGVAEMVLTSVTTVRATRPPMQALVGIGTVATIASRDERGVVWSCVRSPVQVRDRVIEIVRRYGRRDATPE